LLNLPAGCAFRPRCASATEACAAAPEATAVAATGGQEARQAARQAARQWRCHHPLPARRAAEAA
jgi:ABC-type dipeptide/oligopeptide/nickel transport system ATPase component